MDEVSALSQGPPLNIHPPTPAGLESLYSLCRKIYPDQINPLQVTALVKYWLGGPDPLDYISMYENPGIPHKNIPPHWHYISFGLSDLHGDGRVHDISGSEGISGFGFELTFRLKRESSETAPPTWPATLMQSLAKYVFQSGNNLCPGDHVSWHCALDNSESGIQHMLMTTDLQLNTALTPFGSVNFVQIVGICSDELKAAQQWNGAGILEMISRIPSAGGSWHITDMRRGESIFDLDANAREEVEKGFENEGSNLSGVSARCCWTKQNRSILDIHCKGDESMNRLPDAENDQIRTTFREVAHYINKNENINSGNVYKGEDSRGKSNTLEPGELLHLQKLEWVHLFFNLEAGSLLPLAIRGRVRHGRHFTFKSVLDEIAITLVANSVTGTFVDVERPYVAQGSWLQILIPDDLAQDMAVAFQVLGNPETLSLPKTFSWPERKLAVTIVADKL